MSITRHKSFVNALLHATHAGSKHDYTCKFVHVDAHINSNKLAKIKISLVSGFAFLPLIFIGFWLLVVVVAFTLFIAIAIVIVIMIAHQPVMTRK